MDWNPDKTLQFIREFEARQVLWRKDDKLYFNANKKEDAWREIAAVMGEEVDVLKRKMDSLRGSRRREKSRMGRKIKGRGGVYKSKWFAWESMKFLDDTEKIDATISNLPSAESEDDRSYQRTVENSIGNVIHVIPGKRLAPKTRLSAKKIRREERIQKVDSILKSAVASLSEKDECGMFGDYISQKLRKFSPQARAILQHDIHNLIFDAEMIQGNGNSHE